MLTKKQQRILEADIGPLTQLPPAVRLELERAFIKALAIKERQEKVEERYSMYAGQEDTPDMKMERYRQARHIHNGLVPYITCSCFNEKSNAVSCPFVPDIVVGGLVLELPHWWRHRYSLEHSKPITRQINLVNGAVFSG